MTRWLPVLAALLLAGCPAIPPSHPLQICDVYDEPCSEGFECIGYHCIADCAFEGDCDDGFRCVQEQCRESCETTDDCTIGECLPIGDNRPGSACALIQLPDCARDNHCGWGVCEEGRCLPRCDFPEDCAPSFTCDFRRTTYGTCVPR